MSPNDLSHAAVETGANAHERYSAALVKPSAFGGLRQCNRYSGGADVAELRKYRHDFGEIQVQRLAQPRRVRAANLMQDIFVDIGAGPGSPPKLLLGALEGLLR